MARRTSRKERSGMSPITAGTILAAVLIGVIYFGFTKHIPFTHGFRLQAVFESSNSIRPGSPVRIAGVNVGKVKKVQRAGSSDAAVVTMELDNKALPIHKDATLKIRPRIFLEGNFFIDLKPGTPTSPTLSDNDRIPLTQTSRPVQLDEVLTSLQSDARADLQDVLINYGEALTHHPTPAEDVGQDPSVQGKSAARALNETYNYSGPALKDQSLVNQALLGTQPDDLPKLIKSFGVVAGALDRNEAALKGLIVNFNITTAAFAAQSGNLSATIRLLPPTLRAANAAFTSLNAAFPPTRAFAREILPGVRETPATIAVSYPWVAQTRKLLGPNELGGLAKQLQPTTAALAQLTDDSISLLPQVNKLNNCLTKVILPTGDIKINDGQFTSGVENYKEFWYTLVGLAGEGQNFDGNGMSVRFQVGGGAQTVTTGKTSVGGDPLFGNAIVTPLGTRPAFPGKLPPYKPKVQCATQTIPNLNGAATGGVEQVVRTQPRATGLRDTGTRVPGGQRSSTPSIADELAKRLNPFAAAQAPSGEAKP
jgi:phospholipid/cholesterol/gamma-HCH transport system substrate-binding protein